MTDNHTEHHFYKPFITRNQGSLQQVGETEAETLLLSRRGGKNPTFIYYYTETSSV